MKGVRHFFRSFFWGLTRRDYLLAWGVLFALEIFIFCGGAVLIMVAFYMMPAGFSADMMEEKHAA